MSEPTIPLKHAELIHVALATMVNVLETKTDYPTENMANVVAAYKISRDKHLKSEGYTAEDIKGFTEAATDALVAWLEDKGQRKAAAANDFDAWAKELTDE